MPGIDAVVRDAEGTLYYAHLADTTLGTMAQRTIIDQQWAVALPDDADPVTVAAAVNPVLSSWVALRNRINFKPGSRVLILGATGSSGAWQSRSRNVSEPRRSSPPDAIVSGSTN